MMEGLVVMFIEGEQIRIRNIDNRPAPGRRTDDTDDTANSFLLLLSFKLQNLELNLTENK